MAMIEVNGTRLGYEDTGNGSPVLLLHAGIADRRMWREQVPALATRHRVITLDLRGYGDSELPPAPFAHHTDVVGLLDALGIERAALVGCSFGGAVAIDTALTHPERVTALALLGTAVTGYEWSDDTNDLWDALVGEVDPDDYAASAAAEVRFWVVGPKRQPADVDAALLRFAEEMDERALATEHVLSALDVTVPEPPAVERLAELRMPVLVTAGAADLPDISRLADLIAANAPDAVRLPDVPDAAHLLPLERPGPINAALLDFLP
ncbi:Pimeloyl-ACP methyl ester carboxylesterase [Micromonospora pallida]|uniref:Pimeloyl-ACP methyl ester carboxylesterase n=1 Tax=Micromonospora pallida TaxID=145854 RepID=A0A1C6TFZ8_9ACTN|nr:alpha/beta hydrolase [Micromonospora pallida]SCL40383.1 Pimeloyl-ACP methyl ester carboxylesterase [Micromonospora pallida]